MKPLRFGILSTAQIGINAVIPAIKSSALCETVAISSRSLAKAQEVAKELGIPKAYGSMEELLADPDVDVVYIPSPNKLHVAHAIQAADAGKHVLCEKPIAMNADEAKELIAARDRNGVKITEAIMVRYHPRWLKAREIIRSGRIGRIQNIHACFSVMNEDDDDIRFDKELGGGALYDLGIYPITAARFFFEDEPSSVYANFGTDKTSGVDISVSAILQFPGDRSLVFGSSLREGWVHFLHINGSNGSMDIPMFVLPGHEKPTELHIRERDDLVDDTVEVITFDPVNQYSEQVDTFARVIRGEIPQPWTLENSIAGAVAMDKVRESAETGTSVDV